MKIVVLGTRGFPNTQGGVENHCEQLYPRLAKKGCEVIVLARRPYIGEKIFDYKRVKIVSLSCPKNKFLEAFLHTFYGVFVAKKMGCDVLHIHAIGPSLFAPLACLLGLKVVMTNHGPDYERKKWGRLTKIILRLGEYLGSKWANAIICISESNADRIRKKYKREVTVIPNGVARAQISQCDGMPKKYGLTKERYILAVGRFVPEKGFHNLLEAFENIRMHTNSTRINTNDWKLVIVGDADHPDRYSLRLKERVGKNRNIVLTGFLNGEALWQLYSHARLFVLPSYYEGLPIALLEAMSYGLRCIVSDIPGNRDVGLNRDSFFKAGDTEALRAKIREFINKPLTNEEKKTQIDMISERYNWEAIADRTVKVYRQLVRYG